LFAVWLAGRIAMNAGGILPQSLVAAADFAFLPALGVLAARQLLVRPAPRNLLLLVVLTVLMSANAAYHLSVAGAVSFDEMAGLRLALVLLIVLIAIIGGRIVPAFTHNWLHLNGAIAMPRRYSWLDVAAISSIALFALLQIVPAPTPVVSSVAFAAALANGVRLALWRGIATWRAPIVWILHVAYAWVVVGLALEGWAALSPAMTSVAAAHAFGTGAIGTMVLAVMTRAALGHTGRPIVAPTPVVYAYGLITVAALLRTFGVLVAPAYYIEILTAAALAWIGAFGIFVAVYAPMLTTPRVATKVRPDRA
jgi:uncharacterized protein involved in response to NO